MGKVEVPVLHGVDLQMADGEFVAVMGPSGCGKSTLLHILGGLLHASGGDVLIDGINLSKIKDGERTRIRKEKIGFIFQRFNLFPTLCARSNIELARSIHGENGNTHDTETVEEILDILGLKDKMLHKPLELSGGEQQRVAIARAVVNRPAIILADEPTGNLDSKNSKNVLSMLKSLNERYHQTILMITHSNEVSAQAHRVLEMLDGRIVRES